MMEPNSFTSEPQYQRPDQKIANIDYIRYPDPGPIVQPQPVVVPQVVPPIVTGVGNQYLYDGSFGQRFINKFGTSELVWNQLDYYSNAIPLGSFCYAIAFIIYGFYRCKVYRMNDTFLWSVILLFGGIGQATAGFLEWCKGRAFPTALYLTMGFYCLSHYAFYIIPPWFKIHNNNSLIYNFTEDSISAFYSCWTVISFAILLSSARINLLFILQCLTGFAFFLLRAVGERAGSLGLKRNAAGILEAISGFFSLLVCFSQLINNETFHRPCFPTCPMTPFNEIDVPEVLPPNVVPQNGPVPIK